MGKNLAAHFGMTDKDDNLLTFKIELPFNFTEESVDAFMNYLYNSATVVSMSL